jgi:UDP-N-acetylglucosamine 3-dehydrogenase
MNIMLIGLGRWGEKHLRVLQELGCSVWVADLSPDRLEWAIARGVDRARAVGDYAAALDAVDAVDIVTTAESHLPIAERALAAGRHCFIEKPLAATVAEGRRLVAAARTSGRVLQVGHIFRFHPVTVALREALAAGRIGPVRFATGRFSGFKRPRTDVGVTQTDAIHYFDLFAFLFGRPATAVAALQRDYLGRGLDDLSVTVVHYGEVPAVIEANYFVPGTHRECVIVGELGSLVADYGTGSVTLYSGEHRQRGPVWEAIDTGKEDLRANGAEPLKLELDAFRDACAGRRPTPVSAEDGVRALEIVEAAAQAARLGRTVSLDRERRGRIAPGRRPINDPAVIPSVPGS